MLRYEYGRRYEQIGERLGLRDESVHALLKQGRRAFACVAAGPAPSVVRLVDEMHLIADSKAAAIECRAAMDAYIEISRAFEATLTDDQAALFDKVEDAYERMRDASVDLDWAEVKRHMPTMAVTIDLIRNDHHIGWFDKAGVCCIPDTDGTES